jgi:hypothetical protein
MTSQRVVGRIKALRALTLVLSRRERDVLLHAPNVAGTLRCAVALGRKTSIRRFAFTMSRSSRRSVPATLEERAKAQAGHDCPLSLCGPAACLAAMPVCIPRFLKIASGEQEKSGQWCQWVVGSG